MSEAVKFIFENGVFSEFESQGRWVTPTLDSEIVLQSPYKLINILSCQPIVAFLKNELSGGHPVILEKDSKNILNLELTQLTQYNFNDAEGIIQGHILYYLVGSAFYHCRRLAEEYCNTILSYLKIAKKIKVLQGKKPPILMGQTAPYYEFDSLISSAIQALEISRYIIWRFFKHPREKTLPRSWKNLLQHIKLPDDLRQKINNFQKQFGIKIKDYRDCIQHYIPLTGGFSNANINVEDRGVLKVYFFIPDNPEARSYKDFKFALKIDALNFGWVLTNELLHLILAIVNSCYKKNGGRKN
ncbi:MAG: hypothetical protein JRI96_12020 [Deltaproteobacteria bacterium]|nr:hypothetical protein [Deltaproteobacteria bacterium]